MLKEAHDGVCEAHQFGPKLGDWLRRLGYYWPKMIPDAIAHAKRSMPIRSTVTLSIKHQNVFTQHPPHGHLRCGEWMLLDQLVLQHPEDIASF